MNTPEDDAYEADLVTVERALAMAKDALVEAGLWTSKDGLTGVIDVYCYARSGYPIETRVD